MLGESKQGVQRSPFETPGGHASPPPAMLPVAGSPPTLSMMRLSARGRVSRPSLSCARPLLDAIGRHTHCFEPCGLESSGLQCTGPSLIRRSLNYSIPPPSPVEASERSIGHRSAAMTSSASPLSSSTIPVWPCPSPCTLYSPPPQQTSHLVCAEDAGQKNAVKLATTHTNKHPDANTLPLRASRDHANPPTPISASTKPPAASHMQD